MHDRKGVRTSVLMENEHATCPHRSMPPLEFLTVINISSRKVKKKLLSAFSQAPTLCSLPRKSERRTMHEAEKGLCMPCMAPSVRLFEPCSLILTPSISSFAPQTKMDVLADSLMLLSRNLWFYFSGSAYYNHDSLTRVG